MATQPVISDQPAYIPENEGEIRPHRETAEMANLEREEAERRSHIKTEKKKT